MNYNQNNYSSTPGNQAGQTLLPFQIRFENALESTVSVKCNQLNDLINEALTINVKEIQQRYVMLVENIFSFNVFRTLPNSDWKLKEITQERNRRDFDCVFQFLNSNGCLFRLIRQLMIDPNNRFDFPISCLPPSTRAALEAGQISQLYCNKIDLASSLRNISLNAFEFYLFHFAYYITNSNQAFKTSANASSNGNGNVVYYLLLSDYLEVFMPTSEQAGHASETYSLKTVNENKSLWKSLSSTTSNILHLGGSKAHNDNACMLSPQRSNNLRMNNISTPLFNNALLSKSPLVASKILSLNKLTPTLETNLGGENVASSIDTIGSVLYKCETMLNIFTEIWFNATAEDGRQIGAGFSLTVEHMKATRIMIKHLHYFVNSATKKNYDMNSSLTAQYNSGGMVPSSMANPMDDLKRSLWSSKHPFHARLFSFFRQVFDRWPNDLSFRMPLETWLSFVQPWRYTSKTKHANNEASLDNLLLDTDSTEWKRFIGENLFFYTNIFRQVVARITKMLDFNLSSSSFLLFRVSKVFAQTNLIECLKEAEMNHLSGSDISLSLNRVAGGGAHSSHHLLSPNFRQQQQHHNSPYKSVHPVDHESMSGYASLFSHAYRDQMIGLMHKLIKFVCNLEMERKTKKESSNNFTAGMLASIVDFFDVATDASGAGMCSKAERNETAKMKQHLEMSIQWLSKMFDVQDQCIQTMLKNEMSLMQSQEELQFVDSHFASTNMNVYEMVDGIPKLSETGRTMIMNGTLKCPSLPVNLVQGNPDRKPVQSHEFAFLVRLTLWISMVINARLTDHFEHHCNGNTFYGLLLRHVLAPPLKYVHYLKTANGLKTEVRIETLPPRVNLRFLASGNYLNLFLIFYSLSFVFNYSCTFLVFLGWLVYVAYVLTKSGLTYLNLHNQA